MLLQLVSLLFGLSHLILYVLDTLAQRVLLTELLLQIDLPLLQVLVLL